MDTPTLGEIAYTAYRKEVNATDALSFAWNELSPVDKWIWEVVGNAVAKDVASTICVHILDIKFGPPQEKR